jgi:hypothetical protein
MQHTRPHFHGGNVLSEKAAGKQKVKRGIEKRATDRSSPSSNAGAMSASVNTSLFKLADSPHKHHNGHGGGWGSPKKPKNMTKAQYKLIYGVSPTYNEPCHPMMPSGVHTSPGKVWF